MKRAERGARAESQAAEWLKGKGLKLLERNVRSRFGEIDLVMEDGTTLVFVEVRYRSRDDYGGAVASVTPAKQARLQRAIGVSISRATPGPRPGTCGPMWWRYPDRVTSN